MTREEEYYGVKQIKVNGNKLHGEEVSESVIVILSWRLCESDDNDGNVLALIMLR